VSKRLKKIILILKNVIKKWFVSLKNGEGGIKKIDKGEYQGVKSDFSIFMAVQWHLPETP